jgi:glycosyltransferase involved in cell wall biosynthesis
VKVVIFDPVSDINGHYKYFNRYISLLMDQPEVGELVFADHNGNFSKWYSDLKLQHSKVKLINVSEYDQPFKPMRDMETNNIFRHIEMIYQNKRWYEKIVLNIKRLKPDLLLITSEADIAMYMVKWPKDCLFIMHALSEFNGSLSIKKANLKSLLKLIENRIKSIVMKRFVHRIRGVIVFEEKSEKILARLGLKKIIRIPYRLFNCDRLNGYEDHTGRPLLILTVGIIYSGKDYEFSLNCMLRMISSGIIRYRIAGLPFDDYGKRIVRMLNEKTEFATIERRIEYMSLDEYNNEIRSADFILLPYLDMRSEQASGVMFDAIENGTPIIAPDVEPFKTYLSRYKIGLLYKSNDEKSFIEVISKASNMERKGFLVEINRVKSDFSYQRWRPLIGERIIKVVQDA